MIHTRLFSCIIGYLQHEALELSDLPSKGGRLFLMARMLLRRLVKKSV